MDDVKQKKIEQESEIQESSPERILIIKHSALGDFLMSLGAMQAIARAHPKAELFLLTTPPYRDIGEKTGLFKEIWEDSRPKLRHVREFKALIRKIQKARFSWVYDLQNTERTRLYSFFSRKKGIPFWSSSNRGASHYYEGSSGSASAYYG